GLRLQPQESPSAGRKAAGSGPAPPCAPWRWADPPRSGAGEVLRETWQEAQPHPGKRPVQPSAGGRPLPPRTNGTAGGAAPRAATLRRTAPDRCTRTGADELRHSSWAFPLLGL